MFIELLESFVGHACMTTGITFSRGDFEGESDSQMAFPSKQMTLFQRELVAAKKSAEEIDNLKQALSLTNHAVELQTERADKAEADLDKAIERTKAAESVRDQAIGECHTAQHAVDAS